MRLLTLCTSICLLTASGLRGDDAPKQATVIVEFNDGTSLKVTTNEQLVVALKVGTLRISLADVRRGDRGSLDRIETGEDRIFGRIETTTIKGRSNFVGDVTIRLADLRGWRRADVEATLTPAMRAKAATDHLKQATEAYPRMIDLTDATSQADRNAAKADYVRNLELAALHYETLIDNLDSPDLSAADRLRIQLSAANVRFDRGEFERSRTLFEKLRILQAPAEGQLAPSNSRWWDAMVGSIRCACVLGEDANATRLIAEMRRSLPSLPDAKKKSYEEWLQLVESNRMPRLPIER